ncbi:MAG: NADH-quinone oxidoreductase subunit NuoH [Myxococcales bacterium]|nr:NADH-quinone oxidoreductase subunit NuoH [Myxococcales bacterium]
MTTLILYALLKIAGFVLGYVMLTATLLTWIERKQSALAQDRIGPARASIMGLRLGGLLHIPADAIKSFTKEDFIPDTPNPWLFKFAPVIAFIPAFVMFAVIPFGPGDLIISSASFGVLFILAVTGISVYGATLAGWASNSSLSLLGGLRAAAQMISYEVTMGLSLVGIFMVYEDVNLQNVVIRQGSNVLNWGIVTQPLAFFLFLAAVIAETKRGPFDVAEGESELVAGYFTEYSAMRFAMFMLGEFIAIVGVSAVLVTFFLGGWQVPGLEETGGWYTVLQVSAFALKTWFLCWLQLMIRWTLPRFRYDQIMHLGWRILLPLSLLNVLVTGIVLAIIHG